MSSFARRLFKTSSFVSRDIELGSSTAGESTVMLEIRLSPHKGGGVTPHSHNFKRNSKSSVQMDAEVG